MRAVDKVPQFKSEKEEAEWWDSHPEVITGMFLDAKRRGKLKRLASDGTRPVTMRIRVDDLETAQALARKRGLPYQSYMKSLLHQALERERKAS